MDNKSSFLVKNFIVCKGKKSMFKKKILMISILDHLKICQKSIMENDIYIKYLQFTKSTFAVKKIAAVEFNALFDLGTF